MIRRFFSLRLRALVTLSLLAAGCATAPGERPDTDSSALASSEVCATQGAAFDGAAAEAPANATYDAVLAVTTPSCGATFHTAGPTALTPRHLVRIGSITKSYVAVVTLGLVSEGKVVLDGPLADALPDAPAEVSAVTIRQLLQHTSGIFNYTNSDEFWAAAEADPMRRFAPRELVDFGLAKPPVFAPGGGWSYSNTNYILLGMMIEKVTGESVAKVIRERILAPNDLRETFLEGSEPLPAALPLSPGFDTDGTDVSHSYEMSWAWAAGAMAATPFDAARFVGLLGSGALLSPAMQAELTRGVGTPQPTLEYGLGVFLIDAAVTAGAGPAIGHGGDIMGFHSLGLYFPERKTTLFGAVNSDRGSGNDVVAAALGALPAAGDPERAAPRTRRAAAARALGEL
jgi:D-alanyl-D-alanine carboxypeptidase